MTSSKRLTGFKRKQIPVDIPIRPVGQIIQKSSNSKKHKIKSNLPISHEWIINILKEKKLKEYDPNIVHMLSEFIHNYLKGIITESLENAKHRDENRIHMQDIRFAVKEASDKFAIHNDLIELSNDAREINRIPLPFVTEKDKINLPPFPHKLTEPNYIPSKKPYQEYINRKLKQQQQKQQQIQQQYSNKQPLMQNIPNVYSSNKMQSNYPMYSSNMPTISNDVNMNMRMHSTKGYPSLSG